MLKKFIAKVHIDGVYTIEDPKCPSYWKGSGCYDITVDTWCDTEVEVWAETEEKAEEYALEWEYNDQSTTIEVEAVQVESVTFVEDLPGRDQEEAGVIEPVTYHWKEIEKD
jgi:hypothetical protein